MHVETVYISQSRLQQSKTCSDHIIIIFDVSAYNCLFPTVLNVILKLLTKLTNDTSPLRRNENRRYGSLFSSFRTLEFPVYSGIRTRAHLLIFRFWCRSGFAVYLWRRYFALMLLIIRMDTGETGLWGPQATADSLIYISIFTVWKLWHFQSVRIHRRQVERYARLDRGSVAVARARGAKRT